MKLQISTAKVDEKKKAVGEKTRYKLDASSVLIGSDDACDICLEELSHIALSIASDDDNKLKLTRKDTSLDLFVNQQPMKNEIGQIKNGDILHFLDYELKLFVQFEKVALKKNGSVLATIVALIIVVILVFELGLATYIPYHLTKRGIWAQEVSKETTKQELHSLNEALKHHIKQNQKSTEITSGPKVDMLLLIDNEANRIEQYLLANQDAISHDQILDLLDRIRTLHKHANTVIFDQAIRKGVQSNHNETLKQFLN